MTMVGHKIRQYTIVAALGRGGMGDVYAGYDENLKRKVAIKAIQAGRGLTPLARTRFLREAQTLSQLDHPGICRIHDYIEFEGSEYLILELIDGKTLSKAAPDLDQGTKLKIAVQIAQILDTAHGEGIIHRDLKPDNVMLTESGQIKLLDFGLARSVDDESPDHEPGPATDPRQPIDDRTMPLPLDTTLPGTILGSPMFMSPEQAKSEMVSPATDLYSFGLLLQWLFTGSYAYEETGDLYTLLKTVRAARTEPALGIDYDLASLIERLKSRSPARRPTALATRERLEWIRRKPARRNRRLLAVGILAVVLLAGLKYTTDLHTERQKAETNRAQAEDLMGFMLGDLRDKLEPVGRLDVLDDVGAKALDYYASRGQDNLGDEEKFKVAKATMQIGEVRMAQGNMEAARQAFDQSLTTSKELVARDPGNTEWLVGLGAVQFWIGSVLYNQGEWDAAEVRFVEYLDIGHRLQDLEPDNPDWQREVAYGNTNLAALAAERGDNRTALKYIHNSNAILRRLAEQQPDDAELKKSLTNTLSWAGRMHEAVGDYSPALASLMEAEKVIKDLVRDDPANTDYQNLMSITLQLIAMLHSSLGHDTAALEYFRMDLAISSRLVDHDPQNADWRSSLAVSKRALGTYLLWRDRIPEARTLITGNHDLVLEILELDPDNTDHLLQLAYSRIALAQLALAEGQPAEALPQLEESLEKIKARHPGPDDPLALQYLAETLLWRGITLSGLGLEERAANDWEEARGILLPLRENSLDSGCLMAWIRLMVQLGDTAEARSTASQLAAMDFARQDFVRLCRDHDLVSP